MKIKKMKLWSGNKMFYDIDNVFECLKQQLSHDNSMPTRMGLPLPYNHIGEGSDFLEYTGATDIDGKEMCEGDICTANYAGSSDKKYTNVIEWNDTEYGWSFANAPLWTWENMKIIGNKYENPELLTNK